MESIHTPIDEQYFESIFRLYGPKVYAVCFHHCGNREDSRDMVQEIFQSLWTRRKRLDISGPIEHYLLRAAKLKIMEYFRNESIRKEKLNFFCEENEEDSTTLNELSLKDLMDNTLYFLQQLPAKTQQIFRCSREKGLTNKEIALGLQISEKVIEYHISRALEHLRRKQHLIFG